MVARTEITALSDRIAREFDPDRIILFGSHAWGIPAEHSDVDLFIVMPVEGSSFRKAVEIAQRIRPGFYVDLIVRDAKETERRYREGDPLVREALDRGTVLYERHG